jgi:predicted flap endonuclease-1-like 5' DNA nuclease
MPYTLTKGLLWFLLALLIGIVIGWLLRSIRATSQLRAMRAARHDSAELERLRGRVANLEPAVAERDRLRAELAERTRATSALAGSAAVVPEAPARGTDAEPGATPGAAAPDAAEVGAVDVGHDTETAGVAAVTPGTDDAAGAAPEPTSAPGATMPGRASAPDLSTAVLGGRIELDDLTAIEGIDPEIAVLCHSIGVTTWADLADTEVSLLRTMLADAGPRFATNEPDTWPQQARLLATGRWDEFRSLVSTLERGKLDE